MVLRPPATPVAQFHLDAATRTWIGEASSTNGFGRVYDDAVDEGLTLVFPTGREVVFVVEYADRDDDGDIILWRLRPALPADQRDPLIADVVLFND